MLSFYGDFREMEFPCQRNIWSEVLNWENKTLAINEGMADVTVTNMGLPLQGVQVQGQVTFALSSVGTAS
jgi:hypothetical protein